MTEASREQQLAQTFIRLADTLVDDYDVIDLLHTLVERCATLLDAADAGILLPDDRGILQVIASTRESGSLIELLQLSASESPSADAYHSGVVVAVDDIEATRPRWPVFAERASALNYLSMHAIPLRLRDQTIGSLALFTGRLGPIGTADAAAARAFADVATIGILNERVLSESELARQQLQRALDGRVVIEQARGIISQMDNIDVDEAFDVLRARAKSSNLLLTDVARMTVDAATLR